MFRLFYYYHFFVLFLSANNHKLTSQTMCKADKIIVSFQQQHKVTCKAKRKVDKIAVCFRQLSQNSFLEKAMIWKEKTLWAENEQSSLSGRYSPYGK